jgi:dihydrofolate reductase
MLGSFRAWLYRIATNACLDVLRSSPKRILPPEVAPAGDPAAPPPPPADLPWLQPCPDHCSSRSRQPRLLGRGTYEIFAAHWPYDKGPIADHLNSTRKYVASITLMKVGWNNSTLIQGDVPEYVRELKSQDGPEIQVHGSPGLIQTLLEHDLIDEYRLWIIPASRPTPTSRPERSRSAIPSSTSRPRRSWSAGRSSSTPRGERGSDRLGEGGEEAFVLRAGAVGDAEVPGAAERGSAAHRHPRSGERIEDLGLVAVSERDP